MKIQEIEALPISAGAAYDYAIIVVLIRTDEGLTGIGEASLAGRGRGVLGIIDHFRDLLIGQDPAKIEHWWSEMVRGTFWSTGQVIMSAVAGIDMALWDLKGKRLGAPVYDLLGGPTREKVRVYRHLAGEVAEELVEDALRWRERGFTALRFCPLAALDHHSLNNWDPQASIAATIKGAEALRLAVGEGVDLLFDAHTMFSPAESAYLGHALEPYRLYFYEDPIRPLNAHAMKLVREKVNLPIATGEQFAHKWEFQPLDRGRIWSIICASTWPMLAASPRRRKFSLPGRCTGSAPPCITRVHRSMARPACMSIWRCRTSAFRSGWRSNRSTNSSQTHPAHRQGYVTPPHWPRIRPGIRRSGGT